MLRAVFLKSNTFGNFIILYTNPNNIYISNIYVAIIIFNTLLFRTVYKIYAVYVLILSL